LLPLPEENNHKSNCADCTIQNEIRSSKGDIFFRNGPLSTVP